MSFPFRLLLWPLAGMASLTLAGSAYAEIYKWIDDKGVVNYTSTPPPGRAAKELPKDDLGISVVPAPPPPLPSAAPTATDRRVERLEHELAVERATRDARDRAAEDSRLAAVAECEASRGVDCDENPYQYSGGYASGFAPARPFVHHRFDGMPGAKTLPATRHVPRPAPVRQGALIRE